MKNIKEKAKKWCSEHSNKGCTEQCDGCWQLKQASGCEQHNMETAYEAGANYVLDLLIAEIKKLNDEAKMHPSDFDCGRLSICKELMNFLDTIECAEWADNHPNAIDFAYLQNWYQDSIDETKQSIWTDKHLEELFNDFYLIPKK